MNERQREIIIGSILGDAYINPNGGITFAAGEKHLDYLEWKYQELASLGAGRIVRQEKHDSRHNKTYVSCRFYLGGFKELRQLFYPEGKKIFPAGLELGPVSVAVWILDDGHLVGGSGYSIATNGFPADSVTQAVHTLNRFGISGRHTKDNRIYIPAAFKTKVVSLIQPIITPSMAHKISVRADFVPVEKLSKTCPTCSKVFVCYESDNKTYCCLRCAAGNKQAGYVTRHKAAVCPLCGESFTVYNRRQITCIACREKPFPHEVCAICSQQVKARGRKYCSRRCSVIGNHIARGDTIAAQP